MVMSNVILPPGAKILVTDSKTETNSLRVAISLTDELKSKLPRHLEDIADSVSDQLKTELATAEQTTSTTDRSRR